METLIFSKNRPAQLELCFRSHKRFWGEEVTVLYTRDFDYREGYEKLRLKYKDVYFELETDFRKQVIDYVKRNKLPVFYCDDDVMIRPYLDITDKLENPDIACISQRMDHRYNYCFDSDVPVEIPRFIDNMWEWKKYPLDWGYPMSVLGNIFRQEDLLPILESINFKCPNTLEGRLAEHPIDKPLMVGFERARNINLPQNLVQTIAPNNRAGNYSPESLNHKFMDGFVIDLDDVIKKTKNATSCFMNIDFRWVR